MTAVAARSTPNAMDWFAIPKRCISKTSQAIREKLTPTKDQQVKADIRTLTEDLARLKATPRLNESNPKVVATRTVMPEENGNRTMSK